MSDQKPWESFQDQGATADGDQKPWESFGGETKPEGKGFLGHARDLGLSAVKSVIAVPETAVGLLDIPTGGRVGKFLENEDGLVGFRPKQAKEYLSEFHTDQYKAQQQEFQDADGVLDKVGVALSNPSLIANTVTESVAPMLGGGVAARGIMATTKLGQMGVKGAATAGALGEGAMMAGAQAEAIRQETDDGLLTPGQSAAAGGTGLLGSVFGYAGGRLAQKLGIGDVDTMLARGITPDQVAADLANAPAKSIPRQVIEGAISEGFFEELPQSVSEQIIQNLALDREWSEGVDEAIVMGTLAGMAMGGPAAGFSAMTRPAPAAGDAEASAADATFEGTPEAPGPIPALPAPVYEAGPDGTIRTTDDMNAANQAARQAEADRLSRIARGEVTDVTPIPEAPKLSEQMGLNPNAGPMSSAAALAVDSGASQQLADQAALQQAAEIAQQQAKGKNGPQPRQGELIDGETGEIITTAQAEPAQPVDRASELQQRIEYIQQQARGTGWNKQLVQAREQAKAELATLQPAQPEPEQPAAPATLQEGIAQVRADKAEAAAPADIKAVIAKQIPQMTDAELQQAVAHYGPEHKRTAKLNKELAKRGVQPSQQPTEIANATEPQGAGASIQPTQGTQAAPLQEQPITAAQSQPAPADVAPAAPVADSGSRWDGMTPAERQALAAKAGVKPVFAKNLPNAGWDRIGASVRAKLSEAMDPELTASLAESKAGAQELAARAAAYEARKIEGRDIGDGWAEFSKESGTLSVPRSEMPQIKAEHRGAMVNFLNARGIAHQEETVPATSLKPTQAEFSREKVAKAKAFEGGNRSILVSRDGHVLDGHHQWMASREKGEDVKVIRLDAPIRDLVQAAHDFPSSTTDQQSSGMKPVSEPTVRDPHVERLRENKRLLARPSRELVRHAESLGVQDADKYRNVESLEYAIKVKRELFQSLVSDTNLTDDQKAAVAAYNGAKGQEAFSMPDQTAKQLMEAADANRTKKRITLYRANGTQFNDQDALSFRATFHADRPLIPTTTDREHAITFGGFGSGQFELQEIVIEPGVGIVPIGIGNTGESEVLLRSDDIEIVRTSFRQLDEAAARIELGASVSESVDLASYVVRPKKAQAAPAEASTDAGMSPEAETKAKDRPKYGESNKLVSQARREEIRALMRKKALNLNSGVDPELMALGAELAVFHIEAGTRKFADFAKAMIEDIGEKFTPFLRSFYDAARSYPGLDTEGMTPYEETIKQHAAMLTPAVREAAAEVVGTVAERPKARTKKTGAKGDMVLTQDWGIEHIDGYGQSDDREIGNDTKDAFLKETRNYLNAVADALRAFGFEPHLDRKGKPEKPVSVNEGGPAGSGDVSLVMRNEDNGNNVYITVGDTSLRGMVPSTPSGIAIMYRVGPGADRYASKAGNTWAPVDLSANDLAALVYSRVRPAQESEARNEQPANGAQDQGRAQEVRGGGRDPQPGSASADSGDVAPRQSADGRQAGEAGDSGRPGVRQPGTDVAPGQAVPGGRDASDGRTGAVRAGAPDAGTGAGRADGATDAAGGRGSDTAASPVTSPAATAAQARDLHIDNPLDIVGGTPVQRFNRNRAALELLQTLQDEGRQANADEQKVLAGYIGWGSFGQELFQGSWERPAYRDEGIWKERGEWLRNTLGESAWKSAQRSITNAHYTDPPTVMAMWDMVRRMGFTGGKVLEPSMGTGNFYSMMPADLKARSQLTGIELDETTGEIAKQLFPQSNVRIMGYQDSKTPDGFYDLIIGNWPFENTPVADRRYNKLNPMLHDYFFLKTMDQVRPGGIVIGITSAGSMDKQNTAIRRELAKQAELVTSIRLPSGAFEEYAGTKVVTDIVILRKRPQRLVAVPTDATWVETGEYQTPSGQAVRVNRHYIDNPQSIIGTLDHGHGTTTFRAGMIVHRPENMAERLKQAVELVPQGAMQPRTTIDHITYYANETGERHGALAVIDGKLMVAVGDQMVRANEKAKYELKDTKKTAEREQQLMAAVELRKRHAALVDAERAGHDGAAARKALSSAYKAFTKAHGPLRESFALSYLEKIEDPFYAELAALENDDGTPATVMQRSTTRGKRTIENPSVRDAYVLARNQSVNPSLAEVARLSGKPEQDVKAELLDSGAVFEAPNGDIVPSDIYLSGNVREKMREAEAALAMGNESMSVNIQALKDVMPEDVPYFNIETKLGATWVPNEAYKQFIAHMLARENTEGIDVSFRSGRWKVRVDHALNSSREAQANYGTPHVSFGRLTQAAMSNQVLRLTSKDRDGNDVYDSEKTEEANARISKMREDFGTWLWSDPERRQDLEREYNEARNAWATPKYDGSFLTFEGMALTLGKGEFNLRQHQVNAIWRAIVNRRSLNAHEVGTGKTFTMGGIAIESRRYGIAKKPVILAHNANSATVAAEIRMMYPAARVLYVDNLQPKNREIRLRQIANDDWDAIVIPHSLIDRLALREETLMQMAADDIAALEAEFYDAAAEDGVDVSKVDLDDDESVAKVRSVTAKELAKARKRIIENIKKQAQQSSKEGAVTFEDLGIDMILVDEVHEFKKPPIVTRMQMKGLNTQVSGRSIALQFLTRYVRQMNNGGNVHTFTGTPITNTITEIYHQMRYVMESEMDTANVADWDGWFGSFATEVQDVELSAAGDYEMVTRLAGFVNVPELRQMVGQYMDTVFADDMPEMQPRKVNGKQMSDELTEAERAQLLNGRTEGAADRPYKKVINASADMTDRQQQVFRQLQQYAQDWRDASGKERRELMRSGDPRSPIVTEGIATKASFDVRLLDESLAGMEGQTNDDPNSKASRVVANTLEIFNSDPNANQVIFAEIGFSKSVRRTRTDENGDKHTTTHKVFSTMHDIVERLVQGGIPRDQIAIVDGSTSKERRKEIAQAMNESRMRVVIGSTDTLGVGVNMQRNLRAMHHMDAPYMPGELEQRNGRGQRQGNQWNTVMEFRYMTDRLDGRRWQILAVKQRFITAFMKANNSARVIEGEAAADEQSDILESFSEAAGDPRVLQRVKMQKKLESLQRKERMYTQGIADMRRQARNSASRAEQLTGRLNELEKKGTLKNIESLISAQRESFTAVIDGKTYDKRADAIAALADYAEAEMRVGSESRKVGTYAGHPITMVWHGYSDSPTTTIEAFGEKAEGKGIAGAEARLRGFAGRVQEVVDERDAAEATARNMRAAMDQPFGQAADIERVAKQLDDLEKDLAANPVPPPAWLRQGAPIDAEVYRNKKPYIVTGHRYSKDGWFVLAEDAKGATLIPYMEATDNVGMPLYDEREFVAPEVVAKGEGALTDADRVPDAPKFSRSARQINSVPFKRWFGDSKVVDAEGKPLVVYHGTVVRPDTERVKSMGDITAFDRLFTTQFRAASVDTMGSWFSTNPGDGGAQMYSGSREGSAIYPVYLSIQNPQETTFHLMLRRARLLHNGKDDGRRLGEAEVNAYRKWLKDMGKDGIKIVHDEYAENGSTEFQQQIAWIALEPEQIKSAIGNNGDFDPANPDIRRSFAGRNAQGADLMSLKSAQRRIAMGDAAETVRQETGWHRSADGKWRFEISDDQAEIAVGGKDARMVFANAQLNALVDGRPRIQISDVLDHPQLFAAYPSLAEIELQEMPEGVAAMARVHQRATGAVIQVQPGMPRGRLASALLHELQHGIQKIEGFARGGSAKALQSDFDPTGVKTYRRLAGEVEARNTQARQVMTPKLRQMIAPEETADVPASDVIVLFNGERVKAEPQNVGGAPMTEQSLKRAFDVQFPRLAPAVRKMLARGKAKQRGGLIVIDSADPARIAAIYARNTGRSLDSSIDLFEEAGKINGFYDAKSGLTFLVGPNLNPVTGPAVLLHEMTHGQQRKKLDERAGAMLMNRGQVKNADLRAFLDRVAERMIDAGETANEQEAAAYIVEQAVIEGRSKGYAVADSRFLAWVDQTIGQRVGDFLRSFLANVRSWMLRNGMTIGEISVDDLVGYAMAGVQRAAEGRVDGAESAFSRDAITNSDAFKRWFGKSKAVDAEGKPLVVYHGAPDLRFVNEDGVFRSQNERFGMGRTDAAHWFTPSEATAKSYADPRRAFDYQNAEEGVLAAYIKIENPLIVDGAGGNWRDVQRRGKTSDVIEEARANGHDGVIIRNVKDDYNNSASTRPTDTYVVFNSTQIKSADGNNGDFDPSNPDIRFSRSGVKALADRAALELNNTFTAPGKLHWWHKTIGTMYNLAERSPFFKPVFESAQGFIDDVAHYAADAAELAPKLLPRLETWRDIAKTPISAEDNKAIARPIFEGTLMWTRDDAGKPVRVQSLADAAANLSTDEKADILLAQGKIPEGMLRAWKAMSPEQYAKMIDSRYESQMLKPGIVWTDAELRSIFELNDEQVGLYHEFRDATNRSLDTMARADLLRFGGEDVKELRDAVMDAADVREAAMLLRDHLAQMADSWPDRATQLLQTAHGMMERADKVAELQAEGYAPLSRFGKYTVDVVEDGERQYFGLFETKREANQMAEQMRAEFGQGSVSQGTLSDESFKLFAGITPESLELFGNMLGLDSTGDSAQDQAFQEYLRLTKTNRSAMRRLIHRKGIAGYSEDVGRVLASFVYSNARQTAAGLHMGDLGDAVNAIPKEQGELKDAAVRLSEYIKNPQEEAQAVRGLLFAQYLGGSVASAFVNMTQPFAVSFPWLTQHGGARKASSELIRAAKHMSTKGYRYEAELAEALKKAEDDGVVSPQEVHQLMAQARGSGSLRAGDGTRAGEARAAASNAVARLSVAWGKLFGAAEQMNRRVTFIAAYRIAKSQGMPDPDAFARHAVMETQFVYSKASKMQWGRGAIGGTLMTFKTYSVAYMELMHRLWNQGQPGSQERKEGRKAALLMLATLMLMGGAGGLPFAEDVEDLIDGLAQLAGYNFSTKKAKEAFLIDVFGEEIAHFIDKGVSGLPGAPMDVSGRLGMGNLIPGTGLFQERTSHTRDVLEIVGPMGDFANRIATGSRKILGGDVGSGLLELSPVAVRNAAKGVDMAATGMYRDTKGYKVLDTNVLEAALKSVGFQPESVARVQESNWLNQRSKAFYNMKAQEIRSMWATGIFEKDDAKVQRAREAIADWNAKNPEQPMLIRIPDIMRRVREMAKTKDQRIADTAPKAMRAQMREDAARLRSSMTD